MSEFPNVFLEVFLKRKINFGKDILFDTLIVSISPYRMALLDLKELKEKLKDLLENGLI